MVARRCSKPVSTPTLRMTMRTRVAAFRPGPRSRQPGVADATTVSSAPSAGDP